MSLSTCNPLNQVTDQKSNQSELSCRPRNYPTIDLSKPRRKEYINHIQTNQLTNAKSHSLACLFSRDNWRCIVFFQHDRDCAVADLPDTKDFIVQKLIFYEEFVTCWFVQCISMANLPRLKHLSSVNINQLLRMVPFFSTLPQNT